jgi:hypothetical protein
MIYSCTCLLLDDAFGPKSHAKDGSKRLITMASSIAISPITWSHPQELSHIFQNRSAQWRLVRIKTCVPQLRNQVTLPRAPLLGVTGPERADFPNFPILSYHSTYLSNVFYYRICKSSYLCNFPPPFELRLSDSGMISWENLIRKVYSVFYLFLSPSSFPPPLPSPPRSGERRGSLRKCV